MQEVAVTLGELLADADLIHYAVGASENDDDEAIRKALDFSTLSPRGTSGERAGERGINETRLLSPALSSFLRQEEREKCSAIGHFSSCVDTNRRSSRASA
jgi:hypothetical protein